jgi:hypothetical protein
MQTIESPSLADHVRTLPAEGPGRDRQLFRIIDLYASTEAAAALHAAATRKRDDAGVLGRALTSAGTVLAAVADRRLPADDAARDRLGESVVSPEFLSLLPDWIRELRTVASIRPDTGACTVATALELWFWTMKYFRTGDGARAESAPQAVDELAEALCPLLAARCLALEIQAGASGTPAEVQLRTDLCQVYASHASALAGAACAELVFGYRRHLVWDAEGCATCFAGDDLDDLEALMPGIASGARMSSDVIEADGSHPAKRGPCARFDGVDTFMRLRNRLDGCLTGVRIAKDRAATAIARSMEATTPSTSSKGRA